VLSVGSGPSGVAEVLRADGLHVLEAERVPDDFDGVVVAVDGGGSLPWLPTAAVRVTVGEPDDAILRRVATACAGEPVPSHRLPVNDGYAAPRQHRVVLAGKESTLTPQESKALAYLSAHRNRVVPRSELLSEVWGYAQGVRSRAADSCVHRLRQKLERDPSQPVHVQLVRGVGYRFVPWAPPVVERAGSGAVGVDEGVAHLRGLGCSGADGDLRKLASVVGGELDLLNELSVSIRDVGAAKALELARRDGGWALIEGTAGALSWVERVGGLLAEQGDPRLALLDLAVFAGEDGVVGPRALDATCAQPSSLNQLRSKGLVRRRLLGGDIVWAMPAVLRGWVLSAADPGELAAARGRSLRHYLGRARLLAPRMAWNDAHEELYSSRRGAASAARWAVSLGELGHAAEIVRTLAFAFRTSGELTHYVELLDELISAHGDGACPPELVVLRAEALLGISLHAATGLQHLSLQELPPTLRARAVRVLVAPATFEDASPRLTEAIAWLVGAGERQLAVRLMVQHVYMCLRRWKLDEAERLIEAARRLAEREVSPIEHARLEHARGRLAMVLGKPQLAIDCLQNVSELGRPMASAADMCTLRTDIGCAYFALGDVDAAERAWTDAVDLSIDDGATGRAIDARRLLGALHHAQGRLSEAEACFARALHDALALGLVAEVSYLGLGLGLVALERSERRRASTDLTLAADALAGSGIPLVEAYVGGLRRIVGWVDGQQDTAASAPASLFDRLVDVLIHGGPPPSDEIADPQLTPDVALLGWLRRRAMA